MSVWPPNGLTNYAVCLTKLANRSAAGEMGRPLIHASRASPQQEHHLPCFAYLLLRVRHSVGAGCHARYVYPQQPRFARVNTINPAFSETPGLNELVDNDAAASMEQLKIPRSQEIPLGRLPQADEVANAIVFLASDLSSFTTGAAIPVDGGYSQI